MISKAAQTEFLNILIKNTKNHIERAYPGGLAAKVKGRDLEILESIKGAISNAPPLQQTRCEACGGYFVPNSETQKFCSGKCRTAGHRKRNELQAFSDKVREAIPGKPFEIEYLLVPKGYSPFIVHYAGESYRDKTTKTLLNQLRKLNK